MSFTQGRWSAKTPFPDLQLFLGADKFTDAAALSHYADDDCYAGVDV